MVTGCMLNITVFLKWRLVKTIWAGNNKKLNDVNIFFYISIRLKV